ncbi:MAG: hypothetical protein M3429_09405 [Verrucomicrobiota bacterium]|nr:hypothetical protein [Verrucomicrobiota bacterium]
MKAILGSLLCLVLFAAECFAIKGGPPYPTSTNIIGTYAGVLQPAFDPTDPFSANSLGVFTLGIPSTGASTGTFVMFTRGRVFGGTIQGVGDVNKATVSALLDASFNYTLTPLNPDGTVQTDDAGNPIMIEVTASVNGPLNAKVVPTRSPFAASSAKIKGDATVFISNGGVDGEGDPIIDGTLSLDVMGFKQSNAEPASGTITPPAG